MLAALGAFTIWGFIPVLFKQLRSVDEGVVIAHRIIWTLVILAAWQLLRHRKGLLAAMRLPAKTVLWLLLSALLVAINWLTFVWAVAHDQVLATSLGYFINPLVSVLLGMTFLNERLAANGWLALLLAAVGTSYLGWYIGQPPWVALILAFSFGAYGLVRKLVAAGALVGLWWEALWLTLPALIYLNLVDGVGWNVFAPYDDRITVLLIAAGLLTAMPLALFATAVRRLPLSKVGFFQYLAPSISFALAVMVYDEPFTRHHAIAFSLIWSALLIFTLGSARR
jgi:chloramphenicol-sensitive protein RarD